LVARPVVALLGERPERGGPPEEVLVAGELAQQRRDPLVLERSQPFREGDRQRVVTVLRHEPADLLRDGGTASVLQPPHRLDVKLRLLFRVGDLDLLRDLRGGILKQQEKREDHFTTSALSIQ
jgi:hypothetical protein